MTIPLGIVILNWNSAGATRRCLDALGPALSVEHETLVIDNGSSPADWDALQSSIRAPVRLERNDANRGYAAAMNQGLRWHRDRGARFFLLLNNDVRPAPGALDRLIGAATARPDIGIAGPLVYTVRGASRALAGSGRIDWPTATTPYDGRVPVEALAERDMLHGCCWLVRAEVVERIGLLDEAYFAYYEETDYGVRARRAGFRLVIVRDAVVEHDEGASVDQVPGLREYAMMRNRILFARKNSPPRHRASTLLHASLWYGPRRIVRGFAHGHWRIAAAIAAGWWDGVAGRPFRLPARPS